MQKFQRQWAQGKFPDDKETGSLIWVSQIEYIQKNLVILNS